MCEGQNKNTELSMHQCNYRNVGMEEVHYGADTKWVPYMNPDLIRKRAYQLFESKGQAEGHELDDGLQ